MQPNLLLSPACLSGSMAVVSLAALVSGLAYSGSLAGASLNVVMSYTILLPLVSLAANLAVMTSYLNDSDFGEAIYLVVSGVQLAGWLTQTIIWTKCETARAANLSASFCPGSLSRHQHNEGYIALLLFGYLLVIITAAYIARIVVLRLQMNVAEDTSFTTVTQIDTISNSQTNASGQPTDVRLSVLQPPSIPTINVEVWKADDCELKAIDIETMNIPEESDLSQRSSHRWKSGPYADSGDGQSTDIAEMDGGSASAIVETTGSVASISAGEDGTEMADAVSRTQASDTGEYIPSTAIAPCPFPRSSSVYSQPFYLETLAEDYSCNFSEVEEVDLRAWEETNSSLRLDTCSLNNGLFSQTNYSIMHSQYENTKVGGED